MAKKLLAIIVAVAMTCGMFVGCENTNTGENNTSPKLDSTVDNNNQKFIQVAVKIVNGINITLTYNNQTQIGEIIAN